jgi:hypothetical protein
MNSLQELSDDHPLTLNAKVLTVAVTEVLYAYVCYFLEDLGAAVTW